MEVVDSSESPVDEVGGTAAAGGGAGPPDGTVLLFTIRPCKKIWKNVGKCIRLDLYCYYYYYYLSSMIYQLRKTYIMSIQAYF